jgi:hypothetical protein
MINVGDKIGRWEVLKEGELYFAPSGRYSAKRFICKCSCGKEKLVRESTLVSGESLSCGCYASEMASVRNTTHGLSTHKLYNVWHDMIRRCTDTSRKDYKHYGGRGISVCDKWLGESGILEFINDMESSYVEGLELERIDVNGNYCPENCTWETRRIQVINRRPMDGKFNANLLTFNGKTLCLSQWEDETGIPSKVISDRVGKLKWSIEKALTTKLKPKRTFVVVNGTKLILSEVIRNPPNIHAKARTLNITAHQYLADILYGISKILIEVNSIEYEITAIVDRSKSVSPSIFKEDFLKVVTHDN